MMKTILVMLDGLGDRAYPSLGHRTPLQFAATPNLDRLAFLGSNGLFHAGVPGECLPSENAHYLIFGYDLKDFPGRGLLEAVGEGVAFNDDDVLCLAHLAGIVWENDRPLLMGKRPAMGEEALGVLFCALGPFENRGIHFRLHRTRHNDAILIMSGGASPFVSDSDTMMPGTVLARIEPVSGNPEPARAEATAAALNAYLSHCYRVLANHEANRQRMSDGLQPANFLATQRPGRRIPQEPFAQKWGMRAMLMASGAVYGGLARELGFTFVRVKDTEDPGQDLRARIRLALSDHDHDFYHVHTKAPDDTAHTGNPDNKVAAITSLDRGLDEMVSEIEKRDDLLIAIAADHSTPSFSCPSIHSGEPVPVILVGPNVRRDDVTAYDEVRAAKGCLGFLKGRELMLTILNYANRSSMVGHQLGREKRPYIPTGYKPFSLTE
jgi:2,3-bisphosphoglycerate-independent phosphoglycerate mutase